MNLTYFVKRVQTLLNLLGASPKLSVDGQPGPKTHLALESAIEKLAPPPAVPVTGSGLAHMGRARGYLGKKETDPAFADEMVPFWKRVGLKLKTIAASWAAWCGLFVAVALGVNYDGGGLARNWGKYGTAIEWRSEGIPEGAIVWVNHNADCKSSSSNHVTFANGSCTVADTKKAGGTFGGLGGNQGNMVKVSPYRFSTICAVRWPDGVARPKLPVTVSKNCAGGASTGESTR